MLLGSGLWRPAPDGKDWKKWAGSVQGVTGPRGYAYMRFDADSGDSILDLCMSKPPETPIDVELGGPATGFPPAAPTTITDCFPAPTPATGWLAFTNRLVLESDDGTLPVATLPTEPIDAAFSLLGNGIGGGGVAPQQRAPSAFTGTVANFMGIDALKGGMPNATGGGGFTPWASGNSRPSIDVGGTIQTEDFTNETSTTINKRKPTAVLWMIGSALRAGFNIPCPELTEVNGTKPVPANRLDRGEGFQSAIVGNACGIAVYPRVVVACVRKRTE